MKEIVEIATDNFTSRLTSRESAQLRLIIRGLASFPLFRGEKMWCIGIGGVANEKSATKDIDIATILQLSDDNPPQKTQPYNALYERFRIHVYFQIQDSHQAIVIEPKRTRPFEHSHLRISSPGCRTFHGQTVRIKPTTMSGQIVLTLLKAFTMVKLKFHVILKYEELDFAHL